MHPGVNSAATRKGDMAARLRAVMDQHAVWERIAHSFDRSRSRTWPHVEAFLGRLAPGLLLDLMCGNGRHSRVAAAAGHRVVALDWSRPLVRLVHARHDAAAVVGDATRLPFADGSFDACIYVAGLHGLADAGERAASLAELRRVLRPGGLAQVTVWSRDAPRFAALAVPGEPMDVDIPWRADGHAESRHYHLYTADALRLACEQAGLRLERQEAVAILGDVPDNLVVEVLRPA